jgi:hypothetical protein
VAEDRQDAPTAGGIALRVLAATAGAYAVAYFLTAAAAALLFRSSAERVDAAIISSTLGLLAFPAVSIWAFAERRLWAVVAAPGAAALALALFEALVRP